MHLVTPLPLYYAKSHIEQLIEAVEAGVPVTAGTVTIGGASAPITIAGCVVHSLVTDLTAIVLSQIIREGFLLHRLIRCKFHGSGDGSDRRTFSIGHG